MGGVRVAAGTTARTRATGGGTGVGKGKGDGGDDMICRRPIPLAAHVRQHTCLHLRLIESMEFQCTVAIAVATTLHHILQYLNHHVEIAYLLHTCTVTLHLSNFFNPVTFTLT